MFLRKTIDRTVGVQAVKERMSGLILRMSSLGHALRQRRSFSSSSSWVYLAVGNRFKKVLEDGSEVRDVVLFDPAKEEVITVPDKVFPQEPRQMGSSQGCGDQKLIPLPRRKKSDSSSSSEDRCIAVLSYLRRTFPSLRTTIKPLVFKKVPSLALSTNVPMSSSPSEEGGSVVVAIKLSLPDLSWEHLDDSSDSSSPHLDWTMFAHLEMDHLGKSTSSNQRFLVQWYTDCVSKTGCMTVGFLVFREEKTDKGTVITYTKDIGDLCIFLSKGQAFCIPASSCSGGLKPNSIYFAGPGVGIYNLPDGTFHRFQIPTSFQDGDWVCSTTS